MSNCLQSSCGAKIQICRTLMNRPEIVSVGVVWDSERPSLEHIMDVFATVGTSLRLSDVFHSVVDSKWGAFTVHNLVGVVTYYGKHYSTFFFHTKLKVCSNSKIKSKAEINLQYNGLKINEIERKIQSGLFPRLIAKLNSRSGYTSTTRQ